MRICRAGAVDFGRSDRGQSGNDADTGQASMTRRRVAIIGGGFSGAAVAAQLARQGRAAPDVVLIENRLRFGPGLAYGTKDPAHLLNVRASNLSAFPDEPDHFVRWLGKRGATGKTLPTRFAQRLQYGAYIEDTLRRGRSWFGPKLTCVRGTVLRCNPHNDGWSLDLDGGRSIEADAVVLALGNAPPSAPGFFKSADVPLIDPWNADALKHLRHGDVLLLGTGLTAVDVALSFARMRRKGVIYALSRRGQLPRAHLQNAAPPAPRALDLPLPLSDALFALRKEAEASGERTEPWQHVVDRLRARTPELWQRLPAAAQQRFLRHLRPWWDAHRHRMAPEIAAQIGLLQREGRLRVLAGEIVAAEQQGPVIHVQHRQRGSMVRHHFEVAGVVNCTGAAMDLSASSDPLVRQLFDDGLVRAHASGLGLDVNAEGQAIANSGAPHATLYALGPITQGVFWESTAIPEIRVRAAAVAAMLARTS
jgi:uncharacterized NAD(P)/FAD-binding protein YdhS